MKELLREISLDSINFYIEQNLDNFYTKSSQHPNFISHIEDKIGWILAKKADWPECIFKVDFENLDVENEIKNVKQLIKEGIAPNGWTVGPLTKPKNLGSTLERNGFTNVYQQAGMALDLKNLEKKNSGQEDLIVKKVNNEESLIQWCEVVSSAFSIKVDFDLLNFLYFQEEVQFYIGKFKGKIISTLMLYLSSGVAGLHAVSTLPEYRGKGFGFSISRIALIDAFHKGYNVGVLQASALGERVYKKLGFQKYCDIISYALN